MVPDQPGKPGPSPGSVDYRLNRRRAVRALRDGSLSREEACDAQLELMRVAQNFSKAARGPCPACAKRELRHVRYVFGPRLPKGGRCVQSDAEIERIAAKAGEFRCFLIEVCRSCRWNHLLSTSILVPDSGGAKR